MTASQGRSPGIPVLRHAMFYFWIFGRKQTGSGCSGDLQWNAVFRLTRETFPYRDLLSLVSLFLVLGIIRPRTLLKIEPVGCLRNPTGYISGLTLPYDQVLHFCMQAVFSLVYRQILVFMDRSFITSFTSMSVGFLAEQYSLHRFHSRP